MISRITPHASRRYGWRPDLPHYRDPKFIRRYQRASQLPESVDWSSKLPPCYDQGALGSCTANALAAAIEWLELAPVMPSRLFLYFNERDLEGTTDSDAGAQIRDGILTLITQGICPETLWPYDIDRFDQRPTDHCYDVAHDCELLSYQRVDNTSLADLFEAITTGPVVAGFTVYESFESKAVAQSGIVQMPTPSERVVGGHAILITGYDQMAQRLAVRNSWGPAWGQKGYFTIPFQYFTNPNLADDFWLLTKFSK